MEKPKNKFTYKVRNIVFSYLKKRGYTIKTHVGRKAVIDLFIKLKPVSMQDTLIRVGPKGDGGYLVPNFLENIKACFSPGVAETAAFEEEVYTKFNIKSHLADYSVNKMPTENDNFSFTKKFIDISESPEKIRLSDWMHKLENIKEDNDFMLQMDIEGAEWRVLYDAPIEILEKFRIMVIEFHHVSYYLSEHGSFWLIDNLLRKLSDKFSVVHIHPNNCLPVTVIHDIKIPDVVEITFLRNDYVDESDKKLVFPHRFDEKNVPENDDVIMQQIWDLKY